MKTSRLQPERKPKKAAKKNRHRDHEEPLLRAEIQRLRCGDLVREDAEERPDHEAVIEIEERRDERRKVAGFFERGEVQECVLVEYFDSPREAHLTP